MNEDQTIRKHKSYDRLGLKQYPPTSALEKYTSLSFVGNPISSFRGLPTPNTLTELNINQTDISTFADAQPQPFLEEITFLGTPLSKYKYCFEMCVIMLGNNLKRINGKNVPTSVLEFSILASEKVYPYLFKGYILLSKSPALLIDLKTKKRVQLILPKELPRTKMQKNISYRSAYSVSQRSFSVQSHETELDDVEKELTQISLLWNPPPPPPRQVDEAELLFKYAEQISQVRMSMVSLRRIINTPHSVSNDPEKLKKEEQRKNEQDHILLRYQSQDVYDLVSSYSSLP